MGDLHNVESHIRHILESHTIEIFSPLVIMSNRQNDCGHNLEKLPVYQYKLYIPL